MEDKLKQFIEKNYKASDGARTSMYSEGNGDDQFRDGETRGYARALSDVAKQIEMDVAPLEEQVFDV